MGRVMASLFTSADGFAADRPEEATWITDEFGPETQRYVEEVHRVEAMLLGRVTYEILASYWPTATVEEDPMADRMNEIPKLVFRAARGQRPRDDRVDEQPVAVEHARLRQLCSEAWATSRCSAASTSPGCDWFRPRCSTRAWLQSSGKSPNKELT